MTLVFVIAGWLDSFSGFFNSKFLISVMPTAFMGTTHSFFPAIEMTG